MAHMSWGNYTAHAPPILMAGHVVQFASREALAALVDPELAHGRLLCIDLEGIPLYRERSFRVRIAGVAGDAEISAQGVHRQSDLVGLQVTVTPAVLHRLEALAGDAAMRAARQPPEPTPAPAPVAEPEPTPEPVLVPAPTPTLAPESAPVAEPSPGERVAPPWAPVPTPAPVAPPWAPVPTPVPVEATPPPEAPAPPQDPGSDVGAHGLWVETTHVHEPWALGGLLLQPTQLPEEPVPAPVAAPPPVPAAVVPESLTFHGGPGLSAFLDPGGRATLFRWLGTHARAGARGHLELTAGPRGLRVALDGRGHVLSYTDMPPAPPEADPGEVRAARRRHLAEMLVPLGERGRLDAVFRPETVAARAGEKPVPLLEALMQWLDLALTPVGSEPAAQHYHRRLFEYPVLAPGVALAATDLPLDRLQGRFVEESLPQGRALQDLLTFSPLGRPRTWRMLVLLDALGLLSFDTEPPATGRAGALDEMLDALRRRASQGRESHFTALGVHYASHPAEFAGALERIRAKYGPQSTVARFSPETRALGDDILTRATAAYAVLSEPARRIAYRKSLLTPMEVRAAVELLVGQLKLATTRKLPELSQQLADVIVELDPQALRDAGYG
jgi:hypothetical protein